VNAELPDRADLVVVGAGVVGLAHALHAIRRGLSVVVVERDERPVGASVQNFGHACVTAQSGPGLGHALVSRDLWLQLGKLAGLDVRETGTVVVARADDELAVLSELAAERDGDVVLLDAPDVARRTGELPGVVGGAFMPLDLRVDPRTAVPLFAAWLAEKGVRFAWGTTALVLEPGHVGTSRGDVETDAVVVAVGHDVDRHFPGLAREIGLQRCALHMLRVTAPDGMRLHPAVFTGLSLLRYSAFTRQPSAAALRARFAEQQPQLLAADVNLMLTDQPNGDLFIGDTHVNAVTHDPFQHEALDDLLLDQAGLLLGVDRLSVRERWRGNYAVAPDQEFLVATPAERVRVVCVTTGIGMTTAPGLAFTVIDDLFS
jgi:FAD dependent oxidoreductase TIGR03364